MFSVHFCYDVAEDVRPVFEPMMDRLSDTIKSSIEPTNIHPLLKTGYWLDVCHRWFYYPSFGTRTPRQRALQNEKLLPTVGLDHGTFHLRSRCANLCSINPT